MDQEHAGVAQRVGTPERPDVLHAQKAIGLLGQIEDDVACTHGHGALGVETTRSESRLQREPRDDIGVFKREAQKVAQLVVVETGNDRDGEHHLDANLAAALDHLELGCQDVAPARTFVHVARKAVEGEVHARETCGDKVLKITFLVRDDQAVRVDLDPPEALLAAHVDDVDQILAARRLAAGDLHRAVGSHRVRDHIVHRRDLIERRIALAGLGAHEAHGAMQVAVARDLDLEQRAAALVARAGSAPERALVRHGDGVLRLSLLERLGEQPLVVLGRRPHARVELAVLGARARHPHDPLVVGVHLRRQLLQARRAQRPRFMQSTQNLVLSDLKQRPVAAGDKPPQPPIPRQCTDEDHGCR